MSEEKRQFSSGATSTKKSRFELIPYESLKAVADRFELGLERHKENAWNNLSPNQAALKDKEWLMDRASHAIDHLFRIIDKLSGKIPLGGDDDASAVAWAGLVLHAALKELEEDSQPSIEFHPFTVDKESDDCQYCLICGKHYEIHD